MTRSQSRKHAFLLLFQQPVNAEPLEQVLEAANEWSDIETDDFCESLLAATYDHLDAVDEQIEKNLKGWTMKRIPRVSLAILRLSCAQLLYMPELPGSVIIN